MDQEVGSTSMEVRAPWRLLRHRTTKVAFSLQELVGLTSEFSLKWAKQCDSQVIRTDPSKYLMVYRVTCHKKDSDPAGHVVRLKFDFKRMKETGTVDDLDVRATCSCPAFLFWGPQWNLATGDALYGAPRPKFQPPTDPERYKFVICKHIKIVADRIAPVLERMLAKHRNTKDRAQQQQNMQDIELEKQRTQQTVEELQQQTPAPVPDTTPQSPTAPEMGEPTTKGPVKTWGPTDEELGDLHLPGQAPVPSEAPKKPQVKPSPESMLPPETRDVLGLPPVPGPKPPTVPPGGKGKLVQEQKKPSNVTVIDEDEGEPIILPGAKGKLVQEEKKPSNVTQHDEDTSTLKLPGKVQRDESTSGRKLPPNITVHDDDDSTIKINSSLRRLMAGLILAAPEPVAPGRLGSLVVAQREQTFSTTS